MHAQVVDISVEPPELLSAPAAAELERWLAALVRAIAPAADSFALRLIDDGEMRRLNRQFRGRDQVTDVLSFAGEVTPEGRHLGDVAISVPVARRQAATAGHEVKEELMLLTLHGVLHCLGYDHETDDGEMEAVEAELRRRFEIGG